MAVCGDTNIPPIKNAIMIFLHLNSNLVIKYAVIVDTNNIAITEMPVTKIPVSYTHLTLPTKA